MKSALMQWVEERSWRDPETGCLVWKHAGAHGGKEPQGRYLGKVILVRREVLKEHRGKLIETNYTVRCTCGTAMCVEPAHLMAKRRVGRKGQKWTVADRAKIAQATRASRRAKLTIEAVEDIRSRAESRAAYSEKYGIAKEYVTDIQGYRTWSDYANPFMALAQWRSL